MFNYIPGYIRFRSYSQRFSCGGWWLVMAPGLALTFVALAILIWPELLAYLVATVLLFAGVSLTVWGWSMRQIERRRGQNSSVRYDVF